MEIFYLIFIYSIQSSPPSTPPSVLSPQQQEAQPGSPTATNVLAKWVVRQQVLLTEKFLLTRDIQIFREEICFDDPLGPPYKAS